MQPIRANLLLIPLAAALLPAQSAPAASQSILIVLRQPQGPVAQRLAAIPASTPVPEEVRAAAEREQASLTQAQRESFNRRLAAAGATGVHPYTELNMLRAEVSPAMVSSLESDPAVLSLTPLSGDAQPVALPSLGVGGQQSAGAAIGRLGRKSDSLQSPLLMGTAPTPVQQVVSQPPAVPITMPVANAAFMPTMPSMPTIPSMPSLPMQSMPMQGTPGASFMPQPSFMPQAGAGGGAGGSAGGSMVQSLLAATSQLGMQAGMAMPRSAGLMLLVSGGAQIAQIFASNRKPSCNITLDTNSARIPAAGGQGAFVVKAPSACLWQAQSSADWLQIDNASPVAGTGIVHYTVPATGVARAGVITIARIMKTTVKGTTALNLTQGP